MGRVSTSDQEALYVTYGIYWLYHTLENYGMQSVSGTPEIKARAYVEDRSQEPCKQSEYMRPVVGVELSCAQYVQ